MSGKIAYKHTNRIMILILLLSFIFILVSSVNTVSADQSSIYVSDLDGNDDWDGLSWEFAKKSIKNATGTVTAGGTVNIADGVYKGENNTNIVIDKNMTIQGRSKEGTIINGTDSARIFVIQSDVNVTIKNLTFVNGTTTDSEYGGAIYNDGNLTVNNCAFIGNIAGNGGAIYNSLTGTLAVTDSTFKNNVAIGGDGGGAIIDHGGTLTVKGSTFTENYAVWFGGAVYTQNGILNITDSTFTGNIAGSGGAIHNYGGDLTVNDSTFTGNVADYGGAIYNNGGELTVMASTFGSDTLTGNFASDGGAIYNQDGTLKVENSTFTVNSADSGGAIFSSGSSTLNVKGSTFTYNIATTGGAIANYDGALNVNFSRISGNTAEDIYNEGGSVTAEYNWWGSNDGPSGRIHGATVTKWFVLTLTANPTTVKAGGTSIITADLLHDNKGSYHDPANGHVPDGIPVDFVTTSGTIGSQSSIINGTAKSTFKGGSVAGTAYVLAAVDSEVGQISIKVDKTSPTVTSVDPVKGAVNVPADKVIKVTFSESIKIGTGWIELVSSNGTGVPLTTTISGKVLTIKPNSYLTKGTKYTLLLHTGCVTDLAGNNVAGYVSYFTVDKIAPVVKSIDPVKGAVNVPADKVIKVTFSEPVKTGTGWIELVSSNGTGVPLTTTISGKVLTIKPNSYLTKGTKYTLLLHTGCVTDLAGNNVAGYVSRFTTDNTKPVIKSVDPVNGAVNVPLGKVIKVTFSESIKAGTNWIELVSNDGTGVPLTTTISGKVLTIKPNGNLTKGTRYTLLLHTGCVTDLSGNNVAGYVSRFTTTSNPSMIGSTSYGYVEKKFYGNQSSNETIVLIIGVHPQENGIHKAIYNDIVSKSASLSKRYVLYYVHVTKDINDYSKSRMNGQLLAQQFVVPDVSKENPMLVLDNHENHGASSGYEHYRFLYLISKTAITTTYADEIITKMSSVVSLVKYSPQNPTSTKYVTVPIANQGITTIIYETYLYDPAATKASHASAIINALDAL